MPEALTRCRIPHSSINMKQELSMATRHELVTAATGTGKTVTLQALAQGFSDAGLPVLCCDVKGDLSGIAAPGRALRGIAGSRRPLEAKAVGLWLVTQSPLDVPESVLGQLGNRKRQRS